MAFVEIDWHSEDSIRVSWQSGAQPTKTRIFDSRDAAERFAESKLGKRSGQIISTLDMTKEQLAALNEKRARAAAILNRINNES